ncbi:MAG: alkaline phosphatase family protein [Candidatus Aenigmatarchaeota archaeon]
MIKPDYSGKCVTKIVPTVEHILGLKNGETMVDERSDKVLLVVIDGLGYKKLRELAGQDEELEGILSEFEMEKITTSFPTSTVPGLFSILSGKPVGRHGLFEWVSYSEELDMRYSPLKFGAVEDEDKDKFEEEAIKEKIWPETVPDILSSNVEKYKIQPDDIIGEETKYRKPYGNIVEAFVKTRNAIQGENGKSFFYLYISALDTTNHENGPNEEESEELTRDLFRLLKKHIIEKLEDIAVVVTSDHGFMDIENKVYMEDGSDLAERIFPHLKEQGGRKIKPIGDPRTVNFHVKESKAEKVMDILNEELDCEFEVYRTEKMIEEGLFSDNGVSKRFEQSLGEVTLVMRGKSMIIFEPYDEYEGMHGGLTEDELYVPLLSKIL